MSNNVANENFSSLTRDPVDLVHRFRGTQGYPCYR